MKRIDHRMPMPSSHRRTRRDLAVLLGLAVSVGGTFLVLAGLPGCGGAALESPPAAGEGAAAAADAGGSGDRSRSSERGRSSPASDRGSAGVRVAGASWPKVHWRDSAAIGAPEDGKLVRGVRLPPQGRHFFTWDPVELTSPNQPWRRWGTDHAIRSTLRVLAEHHRAFPRAPRLGIGDLSRPHGGDFGAEYGSIGHISHQNGLDVDVYYPLEDGRERAPLSVEEIDLGLSQDLVDRFVAAGADRVFVGPNTGLRGPPAVVQAAAYHDNHLHVRFPPEG